MKGRTEHEMEVNNKIKNLICNYPDYLEDFNVSMIAEGKTYNTRFVYIKAVIYYLEYLKNHGENIDDCSIFNNITTTQIKKYFAETRYKNNNEKEYVEKSGSYINVQQRSLGAFFRFLRESRIIDENPLLVDGQPIKIGKKKDLHSTTVLNQNEISIVYSNIKEGVGNQSAQKKQEKWRERDLALIDLALNTGLRISSLIEINVNDINFDNLTIDVIEKGNKSATVEIDSECANLLKQWLDKREQILGEERGKTEALFISNRKERISRNAVVALVKKYSSGINKHITFHKFRSTFATAAFEETGNLHAVQTSLGHAAGGVTERYLGNKKEERRTVANAVRNYYTS